MGGYSTSGAELKKIHELRAKGWNYTRIAHKMRRSVGFVQKYGMAMEEGLITPEKYCVLPGVNYDRDLITEYIKTADFVEETLQADEPQRKTRRTPETTATTEPLKQSCDEGELTAIASLILHSDKISNDRKVAILRGIYS